VSTLASQKYDFIMSLPDIKSSEVFTRMVVASDYTLTRQGLRSLFHEAPDVSIIGDAESIAVAPSRVKELVPDVVLMEINISGSGPGLRAATEMGDQSPEVRVVVLTTNSNLHYVHSMFAVGVSGYLLKNADSSQLFMAVRSVRSGGKFIDPSLSGELLWHAIPKKRKLVRAPLSRRELEVLLGLARGYTNAQLAHALELSVKTVETYRLRIYRKLRVSNRAGIVEYASTHL
jgi:DNA-binding NarL/FixJ family response regulator